MATEAVIQEPTSAMKNEGEYEYLTSKQSDETVENGGHGPLVTELSDKLQNVIKVTDETNTLKSSQGETSNVESFSESAGAAKVADRETIKNNETDEGTESIVEKETSESQKKVEEGERINENGKDVKEEVLYDVATDGNTEEVSEEKQITEEEHINNINASSVRVEEEIVKSSEEGEKDKNPNQTHEEVKTSSTVTKEEHVSEENTPKDETILDDSESVNTTTEKEEKTLKDAETENENKIQTSGLVFKEEGQATTQTEGNKIEDENIKLKPDETSNFDENQVKEPPQVLDGSQEKVESEAQDGILNAGAEDQKDKESEEKTEEDVESKLEIEKGGEENETIKTVILSEEVHGEEVGKADDAEIIKEQIMEKETSTNEGCDEVKISSQIAVQTPNSGEHPEVGSSEIEDPTPEREASAIENSKEEVQDEGVEKPISLMVTPAEQSEVTLKEIGQESQFSNDKSHTATAIAVAEETIVGETQIDDRLLDGLSINPDEKFGGTKSEANQLDKEEISSNLASQDLTDDHVCGEKETLKDENPNAEEAEESRSASEVINSSKDQDTGEVDETITVEKLGHLPTNNNEHAQEETPNMENSDSDQNEENKLLPDAPSELKDQETRESSETGKSHIVETLVRLEGVSTDEITHDQTLLEVESVKHIQNLSSDLQSEESELKTGEVKMEEKSKEAEILKYEVQEEGHSATKTKEEICSQEEQSRELEETLQEEKSTSDHTLPSEESCLAVEQIEEIHSEQEQIKKLEASDEEISGEQQTLKEETSDVRIQNSSEFHSDKQEEVISTEFKKIEDEETKETELEEDDSHESPNTTKTTEAQADQNLLSETTELDQTPSSVLASDEQDQQTPYEVGKIHEGEKKEAERAEDEAQEIPCNEHLPKEALDEQAPSFALATEEEDQATPSEVLNIQEGKKEDIETAEYGSQEGPDAAKTAENVCPQEEQLRNLGASHKDLGTADQTPLQEQLQILSSELPCEQSELSNTTIFQKIEEKPNEAQVKAKETKASDEQTQIPSASLPSEESELKTTTTVAKIEEKPEDAETMKHESQEEGPSATETKEEICSQQEQSRELEVTFQEEKRDVDHTFPLEEKTKEPEASKEAFASEQQTLTQETSNEQIHTPPALPSEEQELITTEVKRIVDEKTKEAEWAKDESQESPNTTKTTEAHDDQNLPMETSEPYQTSSSVWASDEQVLETPNEVAKVHEGERKEATLAEDETREGAEVPKATEVPANQILPEEVPEVPDEQTPYSALTSEEEKQTTPSEVLTVQEGKTDDKDIEENERQASPNALETAESICLQETEPSDFGASEKEKTADHLPPQEPLQIPSLELPSDESELRTTMTFETIQEKENLAEEKITKTETSDEYIQIPSAALSSDEQEHKTSSSTAIQERKIKESESEKDETHEGSYNAKITDPADQNLPEETPNEQIQTHAAVLSSEKEIQETTDVVTIEQEESKEAEMIEAQTHEGPNDSETTENICVQEEEPRELEASKEEENTADQKSQEHLQPLSSTPTSYDQEQKMEEVNLPTNENQEEKATDEVFPEKQEQEMDGPAEVRENDKVLNGASEEKSIENEKEINHAVSTENQIIKEATGQTETASVPRVESEKVVNPAIDHNAILTEAEDAETQEKHHVMAETDLGAKENQDVTITEEAPTVETKENVYLQHDQSRELESSEEEKSIADQALPAEELSLPKKQIEEMQIQKEQTRELEASNEEIPADPLLREEALDEQIQLPSSALPSEQQAQNMISTEIHESKTNESELETEELDGDSNPRNITEILADQNPRKETPDEQSQIQSSGLSPEEHIEKCSTEVSKVQEDETKEVEVAETETQEGLKNASKTAENICPKQEELRDLEALNEDKITADQTPPAEESQMLSSALPSHEEGPKVEEANFPADANQEVSLTAKAIEEVSPEKQEPHSVKAVKEDENTDVKEEMNDDERLQEMRPESPSVTKQTEEACLPKEKRELEDATEQIICHSVSPPAVQTGEELISLSSDFASEENKHGNTDTGSDIIEEKPEAAENVEKESSPDVSGLNSESTMLSKDRSAEDRPAELETEEMGGGSNPTKITEIQSDQNPREETPYEQSQMQSSALSSEEQIQETSTEVSKVQEDETKEAEVAETEIQEGPNASKRAEYICSKQEEPRDLEAQKEDKTTAEKTPPAEESHEQLQMLSSALPSHEEGPKVEEANFRADANQEVSLTAKAIEEVSSEKQEPHSVKAVKEDENTDVKEEMNDERRLQEMRTESPSVTKQTEEACLPKEKRELEDATEREICHSMSPPAVQTGEKLSSPSSDFAPEENKHGNTDRGSDIIEEKPEAAENVEKESSPDVSGANLTESIMLSKDRSAENRPAELETEEMGGGSNPTKIREIRADNCPREETPDEQSQTQSSVLSSEEHIQETSTEVGKVQEDETKEAEVAETEMQEGPNASKTAENICPKQEEPRDLEAQKEDIITADQTPLVEESSEQLHMLSSALPSHEEGPKVEEANFPADANQEVSLTAKAIEEVSSEKQEPHGLKAVKERESTDVKEEMNDDERLQETRPENPSVTKQTDEACFPKEKRELEDATEQGICHSVSPPAVQTGEELISLSSASASEENKHENTDAGREIIEEKIEAAENVEKRSPPDASDANLTEQIMLSKEGSVEERPAEVHEKSRDAANAPDNAKEILSAERETTEADVTTDAGREIIEEKIEAAENVEKRSPPDASGAYLTEQIMLSKEGSVEDRPAEVHEKSRDPANAPDNAKEIRSAERETTEADVTIQNEVASEEKEKKEAHETSHEISLNEETRNEMFQEDKLTNTLATTAREIPKAEKLSGGNEEITAEKKIKESILLAVAVLGKMDQVSDEDETTLKRLENVKNDDDVTKETNPGDKKIEGISAYSITKDTIGEKEKLGIVKPQEEGCSCCQEVREKAQDTQLPEETLPVTLDKQIPTEDAPPLQKEKIDKALEENEEEDKEPRNVKGLLSEGKEHEHMVQKTKDDLGEETAEKPRLGDSARRSLSDLLLKANKDISKADKQVMEEKETTASKEGTENDEAKSSTIQETETIHIEEAKVEEEEKEEDEHNEEKTGADDVVTVEARDTNNKTPHKKSHNILSGVSSKVKHSISKVKKAITGKSSHPKPVSPK